MKFIKTKLKDVYLIEMEKHKDQRGFFARCYCQQEFKKHGLSTNFVQSSISFNKAKGTLRGLHYQSAPYAEEKLIQSIKGKSYHVVVDLRPNSKTFKQHLAFKLAADKHKMLYVGKGLAHGFLSLAPDTTLYYKMSQNYMPKYARTIRWNDPSFNIKWPEPIRAISDKDKQANLFNK